MVRSQFSIKIFGIHFGNSVLDNSNQDKISYSLTKKSHTCEKGWAHPIIFFRKLLMNFEKPEKSDFGKNEKIRWRYHFNHVFQKTQSYEVQSLRYKVRQNFGPFLSFKSPPLLTTHQTKMNKKKSGKNIWKCHHFKLALQKNMFI